jgi:hypothetical protein
VILIAMDCGEQLGDSDLATGQNGFKLGCSGIAITSDVIIVTTPYWDRRQSVRR